MRRAEDVVWKREMRRRERVRAERVRRVVMAATSAATIWAASLESAKRVADFARGNTKVTFEEAAVRWREAQEEVTRERAWYDACVHRVRDGCARRAREDAETRRSAAEVVGGANDAKLRELRRKIRRCERALSNLSAKLKPAYVANSSTFWNERCLNASATTAPKRSVLLAMNESGARETMARYHSSSESYTSDIERSVALLLTNIDARSKYDLEYMDNKSERLQNVSLDVKRFAESGYAAIHDRSIEAIQDFNSSVGTGLNAFSYGVSTAVDTMRTNVVNASLALMMSEVGEIADEMAAYAINVDATFENVLTWFDDFETNVRPVIQSLEDSHGLNLPNTPLISLPNAPVVSVPDFQWLSPDLPIGGFDGLSDDFTTLMSASATIAGSTINNALTEATSVDIGVDLGIPSLLSDYDPPPFESSDGSTTDNSTQFGEETLQAIRERSDLFVESTNASSAQTSDFVRFGLNQSAAAVMYLTTTNFSSPDVAPDADDFDFFNITFRGVHIHGFFSIAEFAFAGLVNIDLTYRVIRCVSVVSKHLSYGALELEPLNLIDGDRDAGERKISSLEQFARFVADPAMVAFVRFTIFIAITVASLHVYRQTHRSYVKGCVESRNGTLAADYAFVFAHSYVNTAPRTRALAFDSYLAYNFTKTCDARRVATAERFNVADVERHRLETTLDASRETLLAIDACVDVIHGDESEIFQTHARAAQSCALESFKLDDGGAASECQPPTCSAATSCVGPIDDLLRAHAIETACAVERYAHDWIQRALLLVLSYASMNFAREPFVDALGRVVALTQNIDDIAVIAWYDRDRDEACVADDSVVRVRRALRNARVRGCVVMATCVACQLPWVLLASALR